ncbi:MAG TPA: FAD-binding oxidoreductase [Minicystis sp.]|nr:FAD-binding oxidoreductase [Minicystis sp.]
MTQALDVPPAVPTIDHAGVLEDLHETPAYVMPHHDRGQPQIGKISCSFCGIGDGGTFERVPESDESDKLLREGEATLLLPAPGGGVERVPVVIGPASTLVVDTRRALTPPGGVLRAELEIDGAVQALEAREVERVRSENGQLVSQHFRPYVRDLSVFKEAIRGTAPTGGCVKLRLSTMRQRAAYPIHTTPSVLDKATGRRVPISYEEGIARFASHLLAHRAPAAKTLVYASGQLDYFTIFAMQEVFRLLGVRSLTGNAEHCLNSGAVHNEILTGQEGPFLTLDQATTGPNRFYLLNGWNGFVTHPPLFRAITSRPDFDGFLVEVAVTESAKAVAKQLGKERVLIVRPRADPHLALGVAHEILARHPGAVSRRFIDRFAAPETFEAFAKLAASDAFAAERVAERIAPEPEYVERIVLGIQMIAQKMADPRLVPINIPSMGLSQTSGVVAHCLWGDVMAMVGKYGLAKDGTPAGGTVRAPGQINAESEVQGLSRKYFMGRVPMAAAEDAAARMGLPPDAYKRVTEDEPRAALDYAEPTPGKRELFVCFGTQFESNMMGRRRWIDKLRAADTTLLVVDPIPDPFTEATADLIIASPPHPATTKLYQNGEWKMTLSVPQKKAAPETRSDATILYDVGWEIGRRIAASAELAAAHPDLAAHVRSGYVQRRFGPPTADAPGLTRIDGEVSRAALWYRIQEYMSGGSGPLYCRPDHADGRPITWEEIVEKGSLYYGGVGTTRFVLDYDDPAAQPFGDVFRRPTKFKFFVPKGDDLELPEGIVLNSGRSSLSDEKDRVAFATATFNSGKATPIVNMPDEHPLHVSPRLAEKRALKTGDRARVTNWDTGASIELPVIVTDRVKGESLYVSFHKSRAQMERGVYVNDVTSHEGRCPYSAQTNLKATNVRVERVEARVEPGAPRVEAVAGAAPRRAIDTTTIDPLVDLPVWSGQATPLHVTEIIQETHDVFTFRFQGDPLCRFAYRPGQFCSIVLNIEGKKVVRSYSISSTPTRPYTLEVTIKRVPGGLVSNWMPDNVKVGDRIEISGPKGKFHLSPGKVPKKILFLAAGSGVTPLMSMSRWLCDVSADVDIRFFNAVRSPDDIIFEKELEMMTSRYKMFQPIHICSSRGTRSGWSGMTGRISRPMIELVAPDYRERDVYLCGPEGFSTAAKALLTEMGFDLARFHYESFGGLRTATDNKHLPPASSSAFGAAAKHVEVRPPPAAEPLEFTIEFAKAAKTVKAGRKLALLDLAEANDVELDYGCRAGSCGDCKVKLLRGEVHMDVDDGLDKADRAAGYVLSCVAQPRSDCVVDA